MIPQISESLLMLLKASTSEGKSVALPQEGLFLQMLEKLQGFLTKSQLPSDASSPFPDSEPDEEQEALENILTALATILQGRDLISLLTGGPSLLYSSLDNGESIDSPQPATVGSPTTALLPSEVGEFRASSSPPVSQLLSIEETIGRPFVSLRESEGGGEAATPISPIQTLPAQEGGNTPPTPDLILPERIGLSRSAESALFPPPTAVEEQAVISPPMVASEANNETLRQQQDLAREDMPSVKSGERTGGAWSQEGEQIAETWQNLGKTGLSILTPRKSKAEQIDSSFEGLVSQNLQRQGETLGSAEKQKESPNTSATPSLSFTAEPVEKKWGISLPRNAVLLQLEPKELGSLLVQVRLTGRKSLEASFWAESSAVRTLLQAQLPSLTQALTQQGFQTQHLSVALAQEGFSHQFTQFSHQQSSFHSFAQGSGQGWGGERRHTQREGSQRWNDNQDRLVDVVI